MLAHQWLWEQGVRVPEVVHFDLFNEGLQRSLIVTTAIPGRSLAGHHRGIDVQRVLNAAGRDLATINGIPVTGFGFVRRDGSDATSLTGELPTWRDFALADMEAQLAALPAFLPESDITAISQVLHQRASLLDTPQAVLAHGDVDATHIYGTYTGIIDFGEIRGADPLYDLGHFALHDGEVIPHIVLPHLLAGYHHVTPLAARDEGGIWLRSLLIGVRALARSVTRPPSAYQGHLIHAVRRVLATMSRGSDSARDRQ